MLKGVCFESEILMRRFSYFSTKGDAGFVGKNLDKWSFVSYWFLWHLGCRGVRRLPCPLFFHLKRSPPSNDPFFYEMSLINEMSPRITRVLVVPFSFMRFGALKG